ncbi:5-hydroxytryptamine receptor 6-like [Hetaerina americana]|uniref:5-hydroxytryptamine receptor 6-like n=1 Tax=Hetaerina americana TaxID=62018 RepID=UPI003A7F52D0
MRMHVKCLSLESGPPNSQRMLSPAPDGSPCPSQVQTANTLLLLHLGTVDVLLCALFLLFAAPGALGARGPADATSPWASAPPLCSLHSFLAALLHPLAIWTLCGLNCDRCAAIAAPLHYARLVSTRRAAAFLLASWVLCLALALPPLFAPPAPVLTDTPVPTDGNGTAAAASCAPSTPPPPADAPPPVPPLLGACPATRPPPLSPWYPWAYAALTLLLPAALILACNVKVLTIARYHRHRIAAAIFEVTLSAQVTITHQRNPFPLLAKPRAPAPGGWMGAGSLFGNRRSALLAVVQLVGSLLLLYFPSYCVLVWRSLQGGGPPAPPPLLATAASALLACSPPVNAFIYGVRSKVLRRSFANYWRKQMSKSAVNQEIQARTPSTCGSRRPSLTPLGLQQRRASVDACLGLAPSIAPPPPSSSSSSASSAGGGPQTAVPPKMTRVASELSWRPLGVASPIVGVGPRRTRSFRERRTNTGLHTLQVPALQRCESSMGCHRDVQASSSTVPFIGRSQYFLQRVLGYCHYGRAAGLGGGHLTGATHAPPPLAVAGANSAAARRRSPRIMVTRALSQEETVEEAPHRSERRLSASTTALLEGGSHGAEAAAPVPPGAEDGVGDGGTDSGGDGRTPLCSSLDSVLAAARVGQVPGVLRGTPIPRGWGPLEPGREHHSWPGRTRAAAAEGGCAPPSGAHASPPSLPPPPHGCVSNC